MLWTWNALLVWSQCCCIWEALKRMAFVGILKRWRYKKEYLWGYYILQWLKSQDIDLVVTKFSTSADNRCDRERAPWKSHQSLLSLWRAPAPWDSWMFLILWLAQVSGILRVASTLSTPLWRFNPLPRKQSSSHHHNVRNNVLWHFRVNWPWIIVQVPCSVVDLQSMVFVVQIQLNLVDKERHNLGELPCYDYTRRLTEMVFLSIKWW